MDKDLIRKTEGRLYRYFENISKIFALEKEIVELDKRYDNVEDILKNSNFDFDISIVSLGFEERVQTSFSGESAIEKQILNQAERLLKEQRLIRKKQLKNKIQINELERNNIKLRVAIAMLEEEDKKFIFYKYNKKLSVEAISEEFNLSIRTTYRLRKRIIKEIMKLI
ncbi:hypothetical protein [uncultured Clostridium sp.]|uniref:hypothetical protein n=1 Tax=uncultured Clostridium sp. TaxID=59620 RepID=UPI0025E1CEB7|nr:hypothetical protein [uncultured Clostridium sp.]MDU4882978.1 hypothetical protein [Clostridium celatum]MDU7076121.1 hypothetical protein [Clostridium celatum]